MPEAFIATSSESRINMGKSEPKFSHTADTRVDSTAVENPCSIEHGAQTIDPRLLHGQVKQSVQSSSTPQSSTTLSGNNDSASSNSGEFQGLSPAAALDEVVSKNDFDLEFEDVEAGEQPIELKPDAIPYLLVWISQNKGQLPAGLQLRCLEILTRVPEKILLEWIRVNAPNSSAQRALAPGNLRQYRARCLDSNPRYHRAQGQVGKSKLFECTK